MIIKDPLVSKWILNLFIRGINTAFSRDCLLTSATITFTLHAGMGLAHLPPLTFYTTNLCAWSQRCTIAFEEIGIRNKVKFIEIDRQNKPAGFSTEINPSGQVPVLLVGEEKIPESIIILELLADWAQDTDLSLLPETAVGRAKARYFIERFHQVVWLPNTGLYVLKSPGDSVQLVLSGVKEISTLLRRFKGPFAMGAKFTMADCGVAPFVVRLIEQGKGGLTAGSREIYRQLSTNEEYKPFMDYYKMLVRRPSVKATFDGETYVPSLRELLVKMGRA